MRPNEQHTSDGSQPVMMPVDPTLSDTSTDSEGSSSEPRTSRRDTEAQRAKAVSDLLNGRTPDAGPPYHDEASDEGIEPEPETEPRADRPAPIADVKTLAEALKVSPAKLYKELQIDVGDGVTMSLGELKDTVKSQQTATREGAEREAGLMSREAAISRDNQLLAIVAQDLRGKLSPQAVQQLEARRQETETRERQLMAEAMPEIVGSAASLQKFAADVAGMLGEYGFKPHELIITDHRIALVLKDMLRLKGMLRKAGSLENKSAPRHLQPAAKNTQDHRAQTLQRARGGSEADKARAVNALLSRS
jgi:hypothetical protein